MSLARALTKRVKRSDNPMGRVDSIRQQISSPIALVSTTNMLSYNAPDIADAIKDREISQPSPLSAPSTPTRSSLDMDSDASTGSGNSTDATSVGSSPTSEHVPTPTSFSKPFTPAHMRKAVSVDDAPILPARAPSHSKREHERLARKRSLQFSRPSSTQSNGDALKSRSSLDLIESGSSSQSDNPMPTNPFSRELEQLNEVAEEFGAAARDAAIQEDLKIMQTRGLAKFTAEDYFLEIKPLWQDLWDDGRLDDATSIWI